MPFGDHRTKTLCELSGSPSFTSMEEYAAFNNKHRKMMQIHLDHPDWTREQIEKATGYTAIVVANFFNSKNYEVVIAEVVRIRTTQLSLLALHTLQRSLASEDTKLATDTATKILRSQGTLSDIPKPKPVTKFSIQWGKQSKDEPKPVKKLAAEAVTVNEFADQDIVHAKPEPIPSPSV